MPVSEQTKQAVIAKLQELVSTELGQEAKDKVLNLIEKFQAAEGADQDALIESVKTRVATFVENAKASLSEDQVAKIQQILKDLKALVG